MTTAFWTKHRALAVTCLTLAGFLAFSATSSPAQGFRWPEEPKNLQALPKGTKAQELRQVMRGFASALDVRCEYCHVGKGSDLSKFDFPSDEKVTKQQARLMIRMVQAINQDYMAQYAKAGPSAEKPLEVTCMMCHRTAAKPQMLGDLLAQIIAKDGVEAAITQYRELRKTAYGGFAYDFSAGMLTALGERLATDGNVPAALRILDLETEANGEAASTYFTRGGIEARAGMREQALHSFERGLQLAPDDWKPFYQREIDKLKKP